MLDSDKIKQCVRKYQRDAIEVVERYLGSNSNNQAMVKMPTGTGKTGVIAAVSQICNGNVLIIVPNAILPGQIKKEIDIDFWTKIGYGELGSKKPVTVIDDDKVIDGLTYDKEQINIITIQRLLALKSNQNGVIFFNKICENTDIIIFDEGHRELAEMWSEVVSCFKCKKILFTATPYRNDKLLFKTDEMYTYRYKIKDALNDKMICNIVFHKIPVEYKNPEYLDQLVDMILELAEIQHGKLLIRIDNHLSIKQLVNNLNNKKKTLAAGFHSNFNIDDNIFNEGKEIFNVRDLYSIYIHSDMLIEGLDFPELNSLVMLNSFNNAKSFVQQVGRILRICDGKSYANLYLWEDEYDDWFNQWQLYLRNDNQEDGIEYINGYFKEKYQFGECYLDDLLIPRKANIYRSSRSYFDLLIINIKEKIDSRVDLSCEYADVIIKDINTRFWIMLYERRIANKYLSSKYYLDKSLELVLLVEIIETSDCFIFYQDTSGFALSIEEYDIRKVSSGEFHKLLPENADMRNAKYTKTLQSKIGAQTRDVTGFNLNSIPESINEKLSYCRNVTGVIGSKNVTRRYINPLKATISEQDSSTHKEYINWCRWIIQAWKNANPNSYFSRYSKIVDIPTTKPTSIMFEIDKELIISTEDDELPFIESQYSKITTSNEFNMVINGLECTGELKGLGTDKIEIVLDVAKRYWIIDDKEEKTLYKYINSGNFRVFFAEQNIVYYNGVYMIPNIKTVFERAEEWSLWNKINTLTDLAVCLDEKYGDIATLGTNTLATSWLLKSTFYVILKEINDNHPTIDYIICDDQNEEMADFIAISTIESKCYFIHCKQKTKSLSASDFQDVCGQALKNIQYVITSNWSDLVHINKHVDRWKSDWNFTKTLRNGTNSKSIKWKVKRMVKSPLITDQAGKSRSASVDDFKEEFKKIVKNIECKKEVWIVQGGLSKYDLRQELEKINGSSLQEEQVTQLVWFLQSTNDVIHEAGADVKFYFQP
jgi:superfamily II DNA or RNA helicase